MPPAGCGRSTTLALIVHELATNSLKYGALSSPTGTLDISGSDDEEDLNIRWMERGGPRLTPQSNGNGYGSSMVARSVSGQLGGSLTYDWSELGLVVTLVVKKVRVRASTWAGRLTPSASNCRAAGFACVPPKCCRC